MKITVTRGQVMGLETRHLPAATYNLAHTLQSRTEGPLFVPLRSMQFLAILDDREMVFVDHLEKHLAVLVWSDFTSRARDHLDHPVPYRITYYREDGPQLMNRLQQEFHVALTRLLEKQPLPLSATILPF